MTSAGGLKLQLEASRDDRRVRHARVWVKAAGAEPELALVTDAQGRMGYRLAPGEYRLRSEHLPDTRLVVGESGWTKLRLRLD